MTSWLTWPTRSATFSRISQKEEQAVAAINDHLRKFWDPRMRKQIVDELDTAKLDPRVKLAVERLKDPA